MKALYRQYKQVIMYLVFGVATTLVNWIVYVLCVKGIGLSEEGWQLTVSNSIAWVIAVLFAFVTNKLFVFESKCTERSFVWKELGKFVGARAFSGVFEIFLPSGLMLLGLNQTLFGVEGAIAKIITSVLVIILNYVLSKLIVFRAKKETACTETDEQ